ncbi:MAG: hypothetical protein QOG54_724 [Actinomycetota bacterium]|jgi:SAM-dependent methyltransferase|nr:hypothetical protein [Actinomycetota bacterium]
MADAIADLGLDDPLPVACRGTGNPALFEHLVRGFDPAPGARVLDLGCGMGGPGEWLRRTRDVQVIGVDVMEEQVRVAGSLFPDVSACVGSISALPLTSKSFEGAWVVGVLEMVHDKGSVIDELRRVLVTGSVAVVFVHVSVTDEIKDPPASDEFVRSETLDEIFSERAFEILDAGPVPDLPPAPDEWGDAVKRVRAHVAARHAGDSRHVAVGAELDRFSRVLREGSIQPWRYVVRLTGEIPSGR